MPIPVVVPRSQPLAHARRPVVVQPAQEHDAADSERVRASRRSGRSEGAAVRLAARTKGGVSLEHRARRERRPRRRSSIARMVRLFPVSVSHSPHHIRLRLVYRCVLLPFFPRIPHSIIIIPPLPISLPEERETQ